MRTPMPLAEETELRRGPWTLEEDTLLTHYISRHGEGRWNLLAKSAGLKRSGKSCRLRWLNYLKPDIKRGNLTPQEQLLILELHSKWGNRWSKIAQHLPGRTDNEIKNYWRTRVQKQARQLNVKSDSTRFMDAVKCFWMPRLLNKMDQTDLSPSMNSQKNPDHSHLSSSNLTPLCPGPNISETPSTVTSPSYVSLDSKETRNQPESIPLAPNFAPEIGDNNFCNPLVQSEYCYGDPLGYDRQASTMILTQDDKSYDMDGYNLYLMSEINTFRISPFGCHVVDDNWVADDAEGSLWNMDDIWQFGNESRV